MRRPPKATPFASILLGFAMCLAQHSTAAGPQQQASQSSEAKSGGAQSVVYTNKTYGFRFALPAVWKGYSIIVEGWDGERYSKDGDRESGPNETGPQIVIRDPRWTRENPREDIPIMIFTRSQWKRVEEERLVVSAAPVGPDDLGRNSRYVFALPPRYNYDDLPGADEVQEIINHHPLHAF